MPEAIYTVIFERDGNRLRIESIAPHNQGCIEVRRVRDGIAPLVSGQRVKLNQSDWNGVQRMRQAFAAEIGYQNGNS